MNNSLNLLKLKNEIEKTDKIHHVKILAILEKNKIQYTENRNGIFVNMNSFTEDTIKEVKETLKYIKEQEKNLNDIENIKKELNKDYFEKSNKESANYLYKS